MKEGLTKNKNVSVYFAGKIEDQKYVERCQKYIQKENLEDRITYLGEQKDIKKLLLDKDIVCSQREGFGRVTVEGILSKSLVTGAKRGATAEIIEGGKMDNLYKPNDLNDLVKKYKKI